LSPRPWELPEVKVALWHSEEDSEVTLTNLNPASASHGASGSLRRRPRAGPGGTSTQWPASAHAAHSPLNPQPSTCQCQRHRHGPGPCHRDWQVGPGQAYQVRSGQVYYSAEVQDHESHKAAYAASEHRLLKSSYARIVT
jgi:hypothetical protein